MFTQFIKLSYTLIIFLLIYVKCYQSFHVNFYYNYNLKVDEFNTDIRKRELKHDVYSKESYYFNGFEREQSVPVIEPLDICVFNLETMKYAVALHSGIKGQRHLVVFKVTNTSYEKIADIPKPSAIAMDCLQFEDKGYVSLVLNSTQSIQYAEESSAIYEFADNHLQPIQYFTARNLLAIHLWSSDSNMFMLQTFHTSNTTLNPICPYFIWSGQAFSELGNINCTNISNVAGFMIDHQHYLAMANYANRNGDMLTNSSVYKYSEEKKQFELFQTIETFGAADVQYVGVPKNGKEVQHYLIYGSCAKAQDYYGYDEPNSQKLGSSIYLYNNSRFEYYQSLNLFGVTKLLPIQPTNFGQVILLAALENDVPKIFFREDDKFIESKIQYTGEAFAPGISNMRIYEENRKSHFIVANTRIKDGKAVNIFLPRFRQDRRLNSLRQQLVDWVKIESHRLETIDANDLNKRMEEKLKLLETSGGFKSKRDIANTNINSVLTEKLIYPKLGMTENYWQALYYINQALDLLEQQISHKQPKRSKRNIDTNEQQQDEYLEYIYDTLEVNTLTINQKLNAKYINNIDVQHPEFKEITAPKVVVKGKYVKPPVRERYNAMSNLYYLQDNEVMQVRNLQINGKLNEYTWNDLLNNTLKRQTDIQFIKSPINIKNLEAERLVVNNNEVSGQHLGALIPIDGGEYVINQDVQFAAPVSAKRVYINERLNNVHVFKGKFDVLLKRSNETQVIEGAKNVNNVKVMEPITMAGQMLGKQLESITPNKALHDPLVLHGDFVINGNVGIMQELATSDIIDLRAKMSVRQTLANGIRMDQPLNDLNLKFLQPLKANNSLVSFVNQNDLQRLVKLNLDDIQIVEGEKIFQQSLEIRRGFSEVKNLNGVDMENLEKNSFLKHTNQTIKVPMKFGKIWANSTISPSIILNNKNLTDYMTKSGNQTVQGNLIVNHLKANTINVEHLNTNSRIFQQHLHDIYQQKSRNAPPEDFFLNNQKFHGSIYVQNLILNSTINNINVDEIEKNLLQLEGNIKYVGDFKFNYPMNITKLAFYGQLNDINAEDLGKCWLQKKGQEQQEFLLAQTIAKVNAEKGINLLGKLNDYAVDDYLSKTYWITRKEYLPNVMFENPIEMTAGLNTATINSNFLPDELFSLKDTAEFYQPLVIEGDLEIQGKISNVAVINNIDFQTLEVYLQGGYSDTLYVESAYFSQGPPAYKTLNHRNIPQTLDSVWLANENVVLAQNAELAEAYFDGLLVFEGPINNMDFEFLQDNYLSKSKAQDISAELIFPEGVVCENDVVANSIELFGPIVEGNSGLSFDFRSFVENTLKTSGPQIIPANWSVLEAIVEGNLNQVLINNLNLVNDIVHNIKTAIPYDLKAAKTFGNVTIENLFTDPLSSLNNVPLANWINDAVYLYQNYTIHGTTSIESLNVYNDLRVLGSLNGTLFTADTLLLQDREQTLSGNLRIISHLIDEQRFLTNNIANLYADFINSEYIPDFVENLMSISKSPQIANHVIFKEPLKVRKYQGPEGMLTQAQWIKRSLRQQLATDMDIAANVDENIENLADYDYIESYLKNVTKESHYIVDHFEILQTLNLYVSQILSLCFQTPEGLVDLLAVVDVTDNITHLYKWISESENFTVYEGSDFNWLPKDAAFLVVLQKLFQQTEAPLDIAYIQKFISNLYGMLSKESQIFDQVEYLNNSCIVAYKSQSKSSEFKIICMDVNRQELNEGIDVKISTNIKQILSLNGDSLAVMTDNSVELWNVATTRPRLLQKLSLIKPHQIAVINVKHKQYLALLTKSSAATLQQSTIEIYRSLNDDVFVLWQTLHISESIQVEFAYIAQSNDLLLYVLTSLTDKPLLIYQYQGIAKFQNILNESIVSANALSVKAVKLQTYPRYMVAVSGQNRISFVDIVLRKL